MWFDSEQPYRSSFMTKLLTEGRSETRAKEKFSAGQRSTPENSFNAGADTATDFGRGKLVQALILAGSLR